MLHARPHFNKAESRRHEREPERVAETIGAVRPGSGGWRFLVVHRRLQPDLVRVQWAGPVAPLNLGAGRPSRSKTRQRPVDGKYACFGSPWMLM